MIAVLDPTGVNKAMQLSPCPRVDDLNGKVIGLLDNGKPNFNLLVDRLEEVLGERFRFAQTVRRTKPTVMAAAPLQTLQELAEKCDLVINGLGD